MVISKSYLFNNSFYRNFMIQGGDPTGTGSGGESIWGKPFKDELNSKLIHSGRGVVSMANSGPHTNGSQFFILYKSAPHLNFKHTVFGMVVGGLTTLSAMEKVPVDDDDRPLVSVIVTFTSICIFNSILNMNYHKFCCKTVAIIYGSIGFYAIAVCCFLRIAFCIHLCFSFDLLYWFILLFSTLLPVFF